MKASYTFIVKPFLRIADFSELDVTNKDFGFTRQTGYALVDDFCGYHDFLNSKIISN